jgi:ribonuclease VapC
LIVVDTSVLIEVVITGPRAEECAIAIDRAGDIAMSAGTLSEALIVALGKGGAPLRSALERLIASFDPMIINVDAAAARSVGDAYAMWGKGSATNCLNWGDCYAYTAARVLDAPILFIGNDFGRTDVVSVLENPGISAT